MEVLRYPDMRILGHGIDLVEVSRIQGLLETHGERFLQRVFTADERAYADCARRRRAERYAVRFAAKEAVLKALGTGWTRGIGWTDIEVVRADSGQPSVRLAGRCAETAEAAGVQAWFLSLSHTDDLAMASAIAWAGAG